MKQALGPNQEKWLRELEQTTKPQGRDGFLCKNGERCCLGIACELFDLPQSPDPEQVGVVRFGRRHEAGGAPQELVSALKLRDCEGDSVEFSDADSLIDINDDSDKTFPEIAAIIRSEPGVYFTEPA